MNTSKSIGSENQQIDQQHADLGRLVAEITRALGRGATPQELAPRLAKLRAALAEHFAAEEQAEGFYDQIAEAAPHFVNRITDLRDEHAVLLMLADDAIGADATERIDEVFTRLRRILEVHEHEENRLLQTAYCVDIGAKD